MFFPLLITGNKLLLFPLLVLPFLEFPLLIHGAELINKNLFIEEHLILLEVFDEGLIVPEIINTESAVKFATLDLNNTWSTLKSSANAVLHERIS